MFSSDDRLTARSSPAGLAWVDGGRAENLERDGGWYPAPHLRLLNQYLLRVVAGEIQRLIVTMPPRHGKSMLISETLPAWYLGVYPNRKVMLTSATGEFALDLSRKARRKLEEFGPEFFGVAVHGESRAAHRWEIADHNGIMVAAGIGGQITGKGADLLIIDDPIKDDKTAQSDVERNNHWNWWISTARPRLQKGAGVVLVLTRWHEDDLAGRMLELAEHNSAADQWQVLNLPALAEDDDRLGREPGAPLCPDLIPLEDLERTRATQGDYYWSAMYQQRPAPAEGLLFKREDFRYFKLDREHDLYLLETDTGLKSFRVADCTHFQTCDVAASEKEMADYTVIATWAVTAEGDLLLVGRERQRFELPDLTGFLSRTFHGAEPLPVFLGIEAFGHGLGVVQGLIREGLPVRKLNPDKDKVSRARVAQARYEEHKIWHPRGVVWLDEWEAELLSFPYAAHDDQVDVLAYAARQLPNITVGRGRRRERRPGEMAGVRTREM